MFSALLRQCGYKNYIPIMVHNRPYQFNTKQDDFKNLKIIDAEKMFEKIKEENKNSNFLDALDIPDGTYIH